MTGYSLDYILDSLSLEQLVMLYDYGIEFENTKAGMLVNTIAEALSGKHKKPSKNDADHIPEKPNLKKFRKLYGDKIKRPNKDKK